MSESDSKRWYSLSEVAKRLEVHPSTVRRWADSGALPALVTPGGHRRFAVSDIEQFVRTDLNLHPESDFNKHWADHALAETRQRITDHHNELKWLTPQKHVIRERNRSIGRQLMALTLQYISNGDDEEEIFKEASRLGKDYGLIAQHSDLSLTDALQASMFFRDTLIETVVQLPETLNYRLSPGTNMRLIKRINLLLNEVHLAIASTYE